MAVSLKKMTHNYREIKQTLKSKPSLKYRFFRLILILMALISLVSWAFVDFNLGNFKLAWISVIIGLIVAWLISYFIDRLIPEIALREKSIKPNIGVLIGAIFMNVSPLIFQNVNKNIYNGIENCKSYKVLDKSKSTGRRPHFSFKVMLDDKKRTIDCEEVVWDKIEINKSVEICIVNGGFGFDYIKNLSPLNE